MPINRAAIVQQLQWQLQQHFSSDADVHLLKIPEGITDKPQLVVTPMSELEHSELQPLKFSRQLNINLQCQINQTNELLMLQSFDTLATGINEVISNDSQHNLWLEAQIAQTDFDFSPQNAADKAQMKLNLMLYYQAIEADDCPDLTIKQVYLSTSINSQGGPHELVTTLPDNQ